ncbi:uncharacterized protein LOC143371465 isoform X1 [Andrena cerasifolii]|uniref:uncharacterized protein LOC143371465 isoform X1 n=1 Tax=Andrena cerasifolii TaxID=2819439 RepID=UPI004037C88F
MIYEEWYFKKLSESRDTKCEAIETKQPPIQDQNTVSTTVGYRRLRRFKYKRRNSRSSTAINPITHKTVKSHSNSSHGINFSVEQEERNQDSGNADEIIESRIVVSNDSVKDKVSRSLAFGKHFNSATSRNSAYLDTPFQKFDQIGNRKVIELWSNSVKRSETKDSLSEKKPTFKETHLRGCGNGSAKKQENPLKMSFEAWKKKKTIAYRQMLASREKEKQQLLLANLANIKQKRMAEQEQARKKQQRSMMLSKKRLDAVKRGNIVIPDRNRSKEKSIVAEGGVKDGPRKQTDTKLDKRKTRTRTRYHLVD